MGVAKHGRGRGRCAALVVAWVASTWGVAARAQGDAPPDCTPDTRPDTPCVARLLHQTGDGAHRAQVSRTKVPKAAGNGNASEEGFCLPRRYLELWDDEARRESEQLCTPAGKSSVSLLPMARYLSCAEAGAKGCKRPDLGVALEGGGSRSAPFAMGVLAGLQKSGVLGRVDVVSSASGGTYAAYYYLARLLDHQRSGPGGVPTTPPPRDQWFKDCVPSIYQRHFLDEQWRQLEPCEETSAALKPGDAYLAHAPYQYQVSAGQDLFATYQSLKLVGSHWYSGDWLGLGASVVWMLGLHFITLPPHYVSHGLFNWPDNFSPSSEVYRSGIERAYGHTQETWQLALKKEADKGAPPGPDPARVGTRFSRDWTLTDLRDAYQASQRRCQPDGVACDMPLWVLSTTSTAGRNLVSWLQVPPKDSQRFAFEVSPVGHGSGLLGFLNLPPRLTLRDAVGTSAAFLDDEQRVILSDKSGLRGVVNGLLFAINADWGSDIPNFNETDQHRRLHSFMPWPLYGLPMFQGHRAAHVHLSDGGNSDNLGLLSQLRRGVQNIVVSASTEDKEGEFPSLCKLKNELELEPDVRAPQVTGRSVYTMLMPGLPAFDRVCNRQLGRQEEQAWGIERVQALYCEREGVTESCDQAYRWREPKAKAKAKTYDLWKWPAPVVEGCVIRRGGDDGMGNKASTCAQARQEGREVSRLLVIKPALSMAAYEQQVTRAGERHVVRRCVDHSPLAGSQRITMAAAPEFGASGLDLPCQSLAYLIRQWGEPSTANETPSFPQDSFVSQTLNSSYARFGAYFDLGRHYASFITPETLRSSGDRWMGEVPVRQTSPSN